MKKRCLLLLVFVEMNAFSQRYLTFVYSTLDSIIGGTYGIASNYLSTNQNLLFDFYSPNSDTAQKRPLIVYLHGGGFTSGSRAYPSVKLLCRKMAMKGYAVASIDYRLDPNFQFYNSTTNRRAMTDAMHDAKQAIRFFKANAPLYKLDTNSIIIGGESAGAITSMMASFVDKQSEMSAYPLANPNNPVGSNSNSAYGNGVKAAMCLCGTILDTAAIENATNPPILWTHGSADTYIPIALAFNVVLRSAHIGLPIQTKLYQGATHCPWYYGNPNWQMYLDSTINDITTFLYPKITTPVSLIKVWQNQVSLSLYPNPATSQLNIDLEKYCFNVNLTLFSALGEISGNWCFKDIKNISMLLPKLENGIYTLKIELDNNIMFMRKVIIQK
jgi:dienelactone hydrolase